ncbi:enoyl-[acyl-carrier-protein] reductase, mitochondrial-like [Saccoglossus kowalevskii]
MVIHPKLFSEKTAITLPYIVDENSVLVKMIAAPVNPADINTIQGVYPIKPSLPAVGGFEGVGIVQEIGKQVTKLLPGDVVIPGVNGIGTWCSHTVQNENDWLKIPPGTPTLFAATLRVNNCTAYRMLKDFARLEAGDVVIQNAANSGCGQAAIQIAAARGIKTINIVSQASDFDDVCQHLKDLGATEVISDFSAQKGDIKQLLEDHGKPRLALNAVGG